MRYSVVIVTQGITQVNKKAKKEYVRRKEKLKKRKEHKVMQREEGRLKYRNLL